MEIRGRYLRKTSESLGGSKCQGRSATSCPYPREENVKLQEGKKVKHKGQILFLIGLVTAILLASCKVEQAAPSGFDILEVSFNLTETEDKTLVADIDTASAYYSYVAEPLFSLSSGGEVYGGTDGVEKRIGELGTESCGRFTQGKWYFHVYAYNAAGGLIRDGETEVYIAKTAADSYKTTVPITLYRTALRTGNVHFSMTTTSVSSEKPYVQVTPTRQGSAGAVRTFYANTVNADGSASFDFTMTGLQSGVWEFAVALFDNGVKVGGGAVSTYILGGDVTEVSGEVYPTEWIDMGFAITMPEQIEGTIGSRINVQPGEVTFTWKATNGVPASYRWYLDGVLLATETSGTYRHTFTKAGVYSMTCVAIDASGLEMGHSTVAVTILADSPSAASWTFNSPAAGANTKNLPGAITGTPLVHVHMEDPNGVMVYSGYPTLTGSGNTWSGSFKYTQSGTDRTGTISISGGKITLTLPAAYSGPVTLGVSV